MASGSAQGTSSFAINLFKVISKDKPNDNVFVSPLSLQIVLAMAYSGARGPTAKELADVLQISSENTKVLEEYKNLIDSLKTPELNIASNMFIDNSFQIKPDFHKNALTYFKSDAQKVNFRTDKNGARKVINNWVESQTNNKIKDLLEEGSVREDTFMVLVNAIHFLADWKKKFSEYLTREDKFYVNEKDTINVNMMFVSERFQYAENAALDAKILELPYANNQFSMYIILPNKRNGLASVEEKLGHVNLMNELGSLQSFKVDVSLPKFKLTETIELSDVLKKMGVNSMFSESANFLGITDRHVTVSKVIQKAFIDVNEKGTEAAAATALIARRSRSIIEEVDFVANHPFLFAVIDKSSMTLLFIGHYRKPHVATGAVVHEEL